jgi:hypothetical protein
MKMTTEMDSTPSKPLKMINFRAKSSKVLVLQFGGHFGFMQITNIAQSCQSGNKAKMTLGSLRSANVQIIFIVPDISRFMKFLLD